MSRTDWLPLIALLWIVSLAPALAAPPAETSPAKNSNDASPPASATQQGAPAATENVGDQPAPRHRASPPDVEFQPTEEISEDFPVAFPADI